MANQFRQFEVQADDNGNWKLDVGNGFDPGLHTAIILSEDGQTKDVGLFFVEGQQEAIERVREVFPGYFGIILIILLIIVAGLALFNIFLGRQIDTCEIRTDSRVEEDKEKLHRHRKHTRIAIFISLAALVISITIVYLVNRDTGVIPTQLPVVDEIQEVEQQEEKVVEVGGQIIEPLTQDPVEGVSLRVNDTTIRTGNSGQYVFNEVSTVSGIKITYPLLTRAFRKRVTEQPIMDIYFDVDLYNRLVSVLDSEARGNEELIYTLSTDEIQSAVSEASYVANYDALYDASNQLDQEIVIGKTLVHDLYVAEKYSQLYSKVVSIEVINGDVFSDYHFVKQQGAWRLIR